MILFSKDNEFKNKVLSCMRTSSFQKNCKQEYLYLGTLMCLIKGRVGGYYYFFSEKSNQISFIMTPPFKVFEQATLVAGTNLKKVPKNANFRPFLPYTSPVLIWPPLKVFQKKSRLLGTWEYLYIAAIPTIDLHYILYIFHLYIVIISTNRYLLMYILI